MNECLTLKNSELKNLMNQNTELMNKIDELKSNNLSFVSNDEH